MANQAFNISKGTALTLAQNVENDTPATSRFVAIALTAAQGVADTMADFDTLATLLADAANTEATFTSYDRIEIDAVTTTVDDTANEAQIDIPDLVYTNATAGQSVVRIIICYVEDVANVDTDANLIPISEHDVAFTTDGNTVTVTIPATGAYAAT